MAVRFDGKVVLVTGGTSGIGREAALNFARLGAKVAVAGRRQIEGEETTATIREGGGDACFVQTDVSRSVEVEKLIHDVVARYGRIDAAFNCAGIEGRLTPILNQTEEDFDRTVAINLKGVWLCLKYEIKQFLKQGGGGSIVNMASILGLVGSVGAAAYSASKHGVIGLTKTAALETAKIGIRVNAVCPAMVETAMAERMLRAPQVRKYALSCHPVGRFAKPSEIADAVAWMCSDEASYMTGQALVLDGGFLAGQNSPS